MTNEEKAEEICRDYNYTQFLNDGTHDTYTESAVLYMLHEMAKWKDEQFKKEKKELRRLVKTLKVDEQYQIVIEYIITLLNL